jgi:hypothetical protein
MVIANVRKTADDFPAGWTITRNSTTTVTADMVEQNKVSHEGLQIHPESCAARLAVGTGNFVGQVVESISAKSPDGILITVSAAKLPDGPPPPEDNADCRYATFNSPGNVNGIITPAEPPNIADVKVRATHAVTNYDDGSDRVVDQYSYVSALDAQRVVVTWRCSPGLRPTISLKSTHR